MPQEDKARVVQEYVPGKQVTLAHMICNPEPGLCSLIGVESVGAIGIMTITPGEGAIIAADIASKSAAVTMDFIDRFTGCILFTGDVGAVESSLNATVRTLKSVLGFFPAPVTMT
ncbi:MAG: microcompartment protein [Dethiosulfovibrio peptidovorans]|nr:MAG: microcompartment protein [Dethiosulfovibrio peptidovorans]